MAIAWTTTGSPELIQGPALGSLNAIEFDGASHIDLDGPAFDFGAADFSISYWIRNSHTGNDQIIIGSWKYTTAQRSWILYLNNAQGQKLTFGVSSNGSGYLGSGPIYSNDPLNDGQWHYVVAVRNGGSGYLYVDGIKQTQVITGLSTTALFSNGGLCEIGRYTDISSAYYTGLFAYFKLFTRVISESEIQYIYQTQLPLISQSTGLVTHYDMSIGTVPGDLVTVFTDPVTEIEGYSDGNSGHLIRSAIDGASVFTRGGVKIRIKLKARSANPFTASHVFIGKKGTAAYEFAETPTRVTFNGGSSGVSVSTNQFIWSDDVDFTFDATDHLVISILNVDNTSNSYKLDGGHRSDSWMTWFYGASVADASALTPSVGIAGSFDYSIAVGIESRIMDGTGLLDQTNSNHGNTNGATQVAGRQGFNGLNMGNALYLDSIQATASNSVFSLGAGDFSVAVWVKLVGTGNQGCGIMFSPSGPNVWEPGCLALVISEGANTFVRWNPYGSAPASYTGGVSLNEWHHYAFTRSGSAITVYIDGVLKATGSNSTNFSTPHFSIGATSANYGNVGIRVIDDFRLYDGALTQEEISSLYYNKELSTLPEYTSAPEPTTYSLTYHGIETLPIGFGQNISKIQTELESNPDIGQGNVIVSEADIDSYTKLLLHMNDAGLIDSSDSAHGVTLNGDAIRSSTKSKFGGYSAYFDGTGDYLSIPDSEDWNLKDGNFTIDFWVNLDDASERGTVLAQGTTTSNHSWTVYFEPSTIYFDSYDTSNTRHASTSWTDGVLSGIWTHVAIVRNGTEIKLYVNGVQTGDTKTINWTIRNVGLNLEVGRWNIHPNYYLRGYLDEVRVVKGLAVWDSNFTPSKYAYSDVISIEFINDLGLQENFELIKDSIIPLGGSASITQLDVGGPKEYYIIDGQTTGPKLVQVYHDGGTVPTSAGVKARVGEGTSKISIYKKTEGTLDGTIEVNVWN